MKELNAMPKCMSSSGRLASLSMMMVVLAEPAVPTSITGFCRSASMSMREVSRVVSIVGKTIDAKAVVSPSAWA